MPPDDHHQERLRRVLEDRAEIPTEEEWRASIRRRAAEHGLDLPGLSVGRGWEGILRGLIDTIIEIAGNQASRVKVVQVKEKLGGLRFYVFTDLAEDVNDRVHRAIWAACDASLTVCEVCGGPGVLEQRPSGWLATRCNEHFDTYADGTPAEGGLLPGPGPDPHPSPYSSEPTENDS